jgi:hypothetical protein
MPSRTLPAFRAIVAFAVLALALASCGDSGATQEELDRAREQGIEKAREQGKIESIEKQLEALRKKEGSSGAPLSSGEASVPSSGSTSCGGGLSVGPNTTCGFAANVEADYLSQIGSGSGVVSSYSPTTERYHSMYCSAGSPHICTGGNDASVYFP